ADPVESGPLAGQEDLSEYGITYRVPEGWEQTPSLPSGMSLEFDRPEVAHAVTRTDGTHVAFVSLTALDSEKADGQTITTAEFGANMRFLLGFAGEDIRDDGQEQYTVPGAEEATRVDIAFGDVHLDVSMLLVDTGAEAFAVLSVGVNQAAQPTPDEVPEGIVEDILASVAVG
ncbi:MAG: hypothetical protein JK586_05640, partial [Nocardiopsis sp. BM-2018]